MVSTTTGMMMLWFVALSEGVWGASVGPGCGASLVVVSSGVAFPKLPPWAVVTLGEVVSVTVTGAETDTICPPSCSIGAVGRRDLVEVKVVLSWGWCVTLCFLVSLCELPATAAVEGTRLTTVVATEVLAWSLSLVCETDDGDENRGNKDARE